MGSISVMDVVRDCILCQFLAIIQFGTARAVWNGRAEIVVGRWNELHVSKD